MALRVIDLGRMGYREAHEVQLAHVEEVLEARRGHGSPSRVSSERDPPARLGEPCHREPCHRWGRVLLVEHDPVITVSRRKGARTHLVASEAELAAAGVALEETDRGGDITYHGPGQVVVYPILDLNVLMLRLHDYMRLLEQVVIDAIAEFGVVGVRDPEATGVWVGWHGSPSRASDRLGEPGHQHGSACCEEGELAKIAAMGVRVRRWVSMHGLALNVSTNLEHYRFIVPCGLAGRPVTSLSELLGERGPTMGEVSDALLRALDRRAGEAVARAEAHRGGDGGGGGGET